MLDSLMKIKSKSAKNLLLYINITMEMISKYSFRV